MKICKKRGIQAEGLLLLVIPFIYISITSFWPFFKLASEMFSSETGFLGLFTETLSSPAALRAIINTVDSGFFSSLCAVLIGTALALTVNLTNIRLKQTISFLVLLPIIIPSQITALAWKELFGLIIPSGTTSPLYSRGGVIFVLGIEHSAAVYLAVTACLRRIPNDLVEAAQASGAGFGKRLFSIILPLSVPGILSGFLLSFVGAIGNFGVPALLGIPARYPVLTTYIYRKLNGFGQSVFAEVAIISLVLILLAVVGFGARGLASKSFKVPLSASGNDQHIQDLGSFRIAVEAPVFFILIVISVLPLGALTAASLVPAVGIRIGPETVTLENFRFVLFQNSSVIRALRNSLLFALTSAAVCSLVSIPLSYLSIVRKNSTARIMDSIADAPFAVPGIVLSLAIIMAFINKIPLIGSIYSTFWIILVAYFSRFLSPALRAVSSGFEQFDIRLEEAAQMAGAGIRKRLVTIVLPSVLASSAAGFIIVFMSAINELTVSSMLWSTGNETIGVMIYSLQYEGNSPAAAAVSLVSISIVLVVALAVSRMGRNLPKGVIPWQA